MDRSSIRTAALSRGCPAPGEAKRDAGTHLALSADRQAETLLRVGAAAYQWGSPSRTGFSSLRTSSVQLTRPASGSRSQFSVSNLRPPLEHHDRAGHGFAPTEGKQSNMLPAEGAEAVDQTLRLIATDLQHAKLLRLPSQNLYFRKCRTNHGGLRGMPLRRQMTMGSRRRNRLL